VKTKGNYPVKVMNATYLVGYLTGGEASVLTGAVGDDDSAAG